MTQPRYRCCDWTTRHYSNEHQNSVEKTDHERRAFENFYHKDEGDVAKDSSVVDLGIQHQWKEFYWGVHLQSRYALCPGGAGAHSQRLNEAIATGAVPVIFEDDVEVLPFENHHEAGDLWRRCVIKFNCIDGNFSKLNSSPIEDVADRLEDHLRGG